MECSQFCGKGRVFIGKKGSEALNT